MTMRTFHSPRREIEYLRRRLEEAEQTLNAIRTGEADSIVVETSAGPRVFTLEGAGHPYRVLVEAMSEGAASLARDGAILYANRRLAAMLEVPLESLIGARLGDFVADDAAALEALLRDGEGGESRGELTLRTGGGGEVPAYLSLSAVQDEDRRVLCLVVTDLRAQKRNEEIVASERLARSVLEQAAEAIVVCDEEGRVIRANEAAAAICGTNPLRRMFDEVFRIRAAPSAAGASVPFPPSQGVAVAALHGETLRARPSRLTRPDGSSVDLLVSATRLHDERTLGCVVNLVDVTEQRHAEEAERRYAELLHLSDDAIFVWNLAHGIETWNRGAEELYGHAAEAALGRDPQELLGSVFPCAWSEVERQLAMWERWEGELEQRTADGRSLAVSTKMRRVIGDDGIERVLESSRDVTEQRRVTQALRESEERVRAQLAELEAIYASSPVGLAVVDPEGRYLRINDRLAEINGVPKTGHIGRTIREVIPHFADLIEPLLRQVVESGEAVLNIELSADNPADPGRVRTWTEKWLPIKDERGRVRAVNVVVEDVTERKQAEEALRSSEEKFATAFAHNPAGICLTRLDDGLFMDANETLMRMFGYTWEEATGRSVRALGVWPSEAAVERFTGRLREAGSLHSVEQEFVRKSGERFTTEISAQLLEVRGEQVILSTIIDVTERRKAERERERLVAELNAVLASMNDGLGLWHPNGTLTYVNPAGVRILGLDGRDLSGMSADRLGEVLQLEAEAGQPLSGEEMPVMRALAGDNVPPTTLRAHRPDGSTLWLSVAAAPIVTEQGESLGAVVVYRDISDRVAAEERQQDLVRTVSHDLRTPLGALLLQAQMIQRVSDPSDPNVRRADIIVSNGQKMEAMIRDLVEMIRLESGQVHLRPAELDFEEFASALRERFAGTLDTDRVFVECAPGLPRLWADPERLERILVNLLSNALRHSAPGDPVVMEAAPEGAGVRVSVRDQGSGIPAEDLQHLFERFYRARTGRRGQGLGLGLFITHVLVRAHHGTIRVESQVGQGSTFHVTFPGPAAETTD